MFRDPAMSAPPWKTRDIFFDRVNLLHLVRCLPRPAHGLNFARRAQPKAAAKAAIASIVAAVAAATPSILSYMRPRNRKNLRRLLVDTPTSSGPISGEYFNSDPTSSYLAEVHHRARGLHLFAPLYISSNPSHGTFTSNRVRRL
jgi:hypothetical protein